MKVKPGTTLNYAFTGGEQHNLTLANGPLGIGSPDANGGFVYSQKFDRPGTYRFFCGLHPVQMTERVVVENPKAKKKKREEAQEAGCEPRRYRFTRAMTSSGPGSAPPRSRSAAPSSASTRSQRSTASTSTFPGGSASACSAPTAPASRQR